MNMLCDYIKLNKLSRRQILNSDNDDSKQGLQIVLTPNEWIITNINFIYYMSSKVTVTNLFKYKKSKPDLFEDYNNKYNNSKKNNKEDDLTKKNTNNSNNYITTLLKEGHAIKSYSNNIVVCKNNDASIQYIGLSSSGKIMQINCKINNNMYINISYILCYDNNISLYNDIKKNKNIGNCLSNIAQENMFEANNINYIKYNCIRFNNRNYIFNLTVLENYDINDNQYVYLQTQSKLLYFVY